MNVYFGIFIGVFLSFAGTSFYKFTVKALRERREKDLLRTEETLQKLVDKVFKKK